MHMHNPPAANRIDPHACVTNQDIGTLYIIIIVWCMSVALEFVENSWQLFSV